MKAEQIFSDWFAAVVLDAKPLISFNVLLCSMVFFYNLKFQLLVQHDDPDHPGLGRRLLPPQGLPHESG